MPLSPDEMSEMLTRLTKEGMTPNEAMLQIAVAAGVAAPEPDPAVADYLKEVQARLADPAVLARATKLARERGLDLDSLTFGDIDDLVNDATKAIESTKVASGAAKKSKPAKTKAADQG
jgi:hypothetical protein